MSFARYDSNTRTNPGPVVAGAQIAILTQPATTTSQPGSPLAAIYAASTSNSTTLTGASYAGGFITFAFSTTPTDDVVVGSFISIDNTINPAGYSGTWQVESVSGDNVTVVTPFTENAPNPGVYVSGGNVATAVLPNPLSSDGNGNWFFYADPTVLYTLQIYGGNLPIVQQVFEDQALFIPGAGSGSVTSVAMTADGVIFNADVTGSPVTTSGTLELELNTVPSNYVLAGPATTGSPATPTYRLLVAADLPGGAGTGVTSVGAGLIVNPILTGVVSGSPITTSGTLTFTLGFATEPANTFLAGPSSGGSGALSARAITMADFPNPLGNLVVFPPSGVGISVTGASDASHIQDWFVAGAGSPTDFIDSFGNWIISSTGSAGGAALTVTGNDAGNDIFDALVSGGTFGLTISAQGVTTFAPSNGIAIGAFGDSHSNLIQGWYVNAAGSPIDSIDAAGNLILGAGLKDHTGSLGTSGKLLSSTGTEVAWIAAPSTITLQTDGTPNSSQTLLNLAAGSSITLTESGGTVTIASTGGGSGTTPGGSNGQIQYNASSSFGGFTMSGDATVVPSTGVITVTKTNGSAFVASATTDTTNAANISSGKLALARGGTDADLSATGGTSHVLKQITSGAAITVAQLAASDLSNGTTGTGAVVLAVSAALTGTPTAPTASTADNSTKIATTAFVKAQGYATAEPRSFTASNLTHAGGGPLVTTDYNPLTCIATFDSVMTATAVIVFVDAGASTVQMSYLHAGTTTAISPVLTPAVVAGITPRVACANTLGNAMTIQGVSVTCSALSNTALAAGDTLQITGGVADGTSTRMTVQLMALSS